jgi:hypothetical protein
MLSELSETLSRDAAARRQRLIKMKQATLSIELFIVVSSTICDVIMTFWLISSSDRMHYGFVSLGIIFLSNFCQTLFMVSVGKARLLSWDTTIAVAGFGSVRQALHMLRLAKLGIADGANNGGTGVSRSSLYHMFRVIETTTELIPELCLQIVVIVNSPQWWFFQFISVVTSLLSAAYAVTSAQLGLAASNDRKVLSSLQYPPFDESLPV